jgi:hypothetical protein
MNPFSQSTVKAQAAPNMGSTFSCRGVSFEVDADGCVELPRDVFEELKPHGLSLAPPPPDAPKKK